MGRNRMFTDEQVKLIQDDPREYKLIAREYGVTVLTIGKVKRKEGAYADLPAIPDHPVLDASGIIQNPVEPPISEVVEGFVAFVPPVRHD
jgi:hypothetical protein